MNTQCETRKQAWRFAVVLAVLVGFAGQLHAQEVTATGTQPGGANWNQATWTGGQWSDGLAPSLAKTYGTGAFTIRTVDPGSSTFAGASLRITAGGMLSLKQAYLNTATANLVLDGGTLFSGVGTTGGNLQYVAGNVQVLSPSFVSLADVDSRRVSMRNGAMSGSGSITIQGGTDVNDIIQLEGTMTSTHTGNWIINAGRLVVNLDSHIGDRASVTLGGTTTTAFLDFRSAQRIGSLSGIGAVRTGVTNSLTLNVGTNGMDTTFSGLIENGSGTVGLAKEGFGMLTLSGNNTFTGNVNARYGVLLLTHGNALGTTAKTVSCNTAAGAGTIHLTGGITIPAALAFNVSGAGDGTMAPLVNLAGTNTIGGNLTLTSGRGNTELVSRSGLFAVGGNITPNATFRQLILSGAGDGILRGVVANGTTVNLPVIKNGAGTWTLSGANTYSGTTTASAGTLALAGQNAAQNSTVTLNGGRLVFSGSVAGRAFTLGGLAASGTGSGFDVALENDAATPAAVSLTVGGNNASTTYAGVLNGAGSLTKVGAGLLTLTGTNAYAGVTSIAAGTLVLSGGANRLPPVTDVAVTGTLDLNGQDQAIDALAGTGSVLTGGGALTVGSADGTSVFSGVISGGGSVTKAGAGTVTLSGTNTYTGATTVQAGRLTLKGSATSDIAVNAGTLGGEGSTTGSLTLNGGTALVVDPATEGALTANGVTFAGTVDIAFDVAPTSGEFTVLDYGAGALSGISNVTATSARSPVVTDDAANHRVRLAVATGARTWVGAPAATWDNGTSTAWQEGDQLFYSGDAVRFDDTASGSTTVTLAGTLVPAAVTFTNETQAYALEGAGAIGGVAALTKEGAGMLTIAAAQAYAGGTTLRGGRLRIGNDSALGTGALTIDGGALSSDSATNRVFAAPVTLNGAFTLGDAADSGALTLAGPIALATNVAVDVQAAGAGSHALSGSLGDGAGSFGLTKSGAGTLVLGGVNAYDGGTIVDGGTLQANGAGALPGVAQVNGGGTLTLSSGGATTWAQAITGTGALQILLSGTPAANTYVSNAAGFTGPIRVSAGGATGNKWNVTNLGTLGGALTVDSGGQIFLTGGTVTFGGGITVGGAGNNENRGAIRIGGATAVLNGAITLQSNTTIGGETVGATIAGNITGTATAGNTQTLTQGTANSTAGCILSGVIADGAGGGMVALTQNNGALTLSGPNTYTGGTTVNLGTVNVAGNQTAATGGWTIGKGNATAGTVNVQAGASLAVASGRKIQVGSIPGDAVTAGAGQALNVAGSVANDGTLAIGRGATVSVNSGGAWTQNGDMSLDGIGGYTATLTVGAGGTFNYAGSNSIKVNPAAGNTGDALLTVGGTFVTGQGFERTAVPAAGGVTTLTLTGGVVRLSADVADLTVNSAGKPFTFALGTGGGTLDTDGHAGGVSGVISGTGALTKAGAGTLTLSGVNTYTGLTTILGGTLRLGATGVLKAANAVVLDGGALEATAGANTVGTLQVRNGNGALVLGGGSLAFADSRAQAWGSGKIAISGQLGTVAPTNLRFGTSADALTPEQLAALSFDGRTVELDPQGYVIAHASPGTVLIVR